MSREPRCSWGPPGGGYRPLASMSLTFVCAADDDRISTWKHADNAWLWLSTYNRFGCNAYIEKVWRTLDARWVLNEGAQQQWGLTMSTKTNGYQAIYVYGADVASTIKVDMGVRGRRRLTFRTLSAAMAFVEGFAADKLTVRIGDRLPPLARTMR